MKFALLSHILPPSHSGQAIMLYRILRDWDPAEYCLLSRQACPIRDGQAVGTERLVGGYVHLPPEPQLRAPDWPVVRQLRALWNVRSAVRGRADSVCRALREQNCTALIACTGNLFDAPAGYIACRRAGLPFFLYVFDDFATQFPRGYQGFYARRWQRRLMVGAAGVIVPNELLRDDYRSRYGIEATVIHNPVDPAAATAPATRPWPACPPRVGVLYTGAVYEAHFDAFRNLVQALDRVNPGAREGAATGQPGGRRREIRLDVYTGCDHDALRAVGIQGPVDFHAPVPSAAAMELQRQADVLFLPLAFHSPYPYIVRTSAPGKIGEYLSSGRPILVHAPADSFASLYFRGHDCGLVVDVDDPAALARALDRLVAEPDLRQRLVRNALLRAKQDFQADGATGALRALLLSSRGQAVRDALPTPGPESQAHDNGNAAAD